MRIESVRCSEVSVKPSDTSGVLVSMEVCDGKAFREAIMRNADDADDDWPLFKRYSEVVERNRKLAARVAELEGALRDWEKVALLACAGVIPTPDKPSLRPVRPSHLAELRKHFESENARLQEQVAKLYRTDGSVTMRAQACFEDQMPEDLEDVARSADAKLARLREALEYYAEPSEPGAFSLVDAKGGFLTDFNSLGERARKALAESGAT